MPKYIIAVETVCLLFMLVLFFGSAVENKFKKLKNQLFSVCVGFDIMALIFDIASWGADVYHNTSYLALIAGYFSVIMAMLISTAFIYYMIAMISERQKISYWPAHAAGIFNLLGVAIATVGTITGDVFTISYGVFTEGLWYPSISAFSWITLTYVIVLIIAYHKALGIHDTLCMVFYVLIPALAVVIDFRTGFSAIYGAIAVSLSIVYVMIQSQEMSELSLREKLMEELSHKDSLTGLLNRRAFDEAIEDCKGRGGNCVGVVFADLNGLKYANDNFGHEVGDNLIISFANLLKRYFRYNDIFRISGDEFVVITAEPFENEFNRKVEIFKNTVHVNSDAASVGVAYGPHAQALRLVSMAEKKMYEEKKIYYIKSGRDRRSH